MVEGGAGAKAIQVFEENYPQKPKTEILQMMTDVLEKSPVPLPHVRDQDITNVIDIGPKSIPSKAKRDSFIKEAKKHPDVKNFKHPPHDISFHLEIDQYES